MVYNEPSICEEEVRIDRKFNSNRDVAKAVCLLVNLIKKQKQTASGG